MAVIQTIRVVSVQGADVIDKTTTISGDAKTVFKVPVFGSGVQALNDVALTPDNLLSLTMTNNLASGQLAVTINSQSGGVTINIPHGQPYTWWSGNGFTNPLAACSGQATSGTVQRVSGYDTTTSGSYNFDMVSIRNG